MMTSRDRVRMALNHQEPDRVPIDLGGTVVSSIGIPAYAALRQYLGLPNNPIRVQEQVQQIAVVDEDVLDLLGIDTVPVMSMGQAPVTTDADGGQKMIDAFGAVLERPAGSYYFDWRQFPLVEPSLQDLAKMSWPDPTDPKPFVGLRQQALKLQATGRALVGMAPQGHDLFNQIFRVRGMENGLMDLLAEPEFAEAFLDRLTDTIIAFQERFLTEVGDLLDVHFAADDLAGQDGPLLDPALWRRLVKPRQARIIAAIKSHTKAKVFYHSCGAIRQFIPDLIEIGVDILNPVQVSAAGMDPLELKRLYGKSLSFWGGACDTQRVLPFGTAAEVVAEARCRLSQLAPGGGFIFNPVHNIQPMVPPENIVALFRTALPETSAALV